MSALQAPQMSMQTIPLWRHIFIVLQNTSAFKSTDLCGKLLASKDINWYLQSIQQIFYKECVREYISFAALQLCPILSGDSD